MTNTRQRAWKLICSACGDTQPGNALATICGKCGQPFLVEYEGPAPRRDELWTRLDMWHYAPLMPLLEGEQPVSLGEGATPLLDAPGAAKAVGVRKVWIKEEGLNPTGSFKARGMSAAVTRARGLGVKGFVVPTAGNAGAALAAYAAAAGIPVRVFAPRETPVNILKTIRAFGAELVLVEGHIGDAGKQSRAYAAESGHFDVSTLREPYRIEGKKTMGLELAEQLGWSRLPKMIVAQADGCAPIVRAWQAGADRATPWENPRTHAAGLRVPGPLGDRLILRAVKESGGDAVAVSEDEIRGDTEWLARTGVDAAPEGGCAMAVLRRMVKDGRIGKDAEVVVFNTGNGASYRS